MFRSLRPLGRQATQARKLLGPGFLGPRAPARLNSTYIIPKRRRWPGILALTLGVGAIYGGWKYYTYHRYPKIVADKLREGLMAEINGGGFRKPDYQKALMAYLEALELAEKNGVDLYSDEYTGILLKIAEVYSRLGLLDDALNIYMELLTVYHGLIMSGKLPEHKDHFIKRDLMLVTEIAVARSPQLDVMRALILPHVALAQKDLLLKAAAAAKVFASNVTTDSPIYKEFEEGKAPGSAKFTVPIYFDELLSLRDLYTGFSIAVGDYYGALITKLRTTELELSAGAPIGQCLMSATNLGSLLFIQSNVEEVGEKLVAEEAGETAAAEQSAQTTEAAKAEGAPPLIPVEGASQTDRKAAVEKGLAEAFSKVTAANGMGSQAPNIGSLGMNGAPTDKARQNSMEIRHTVPAALVAPGAGDKSAESFMAAAQHQYETVLKLINDLPVWSRRTQLVSEALAISTYGLGVIAADKGDWNQASQLLREARLRGRGLQVEELMASADTELAKIDKLRDSKVPKEQLDAKQIPDLSVLFWSLDPVEWAAKQPE